MKALFQNSGLGKQRERSALSLVGRNEQYLTVADEHRSGHMSCNRLQKRDGSLFQGKVHIFQIKFGVANLVDLGSVESYRAQVAIESNCL